ncbi:hypothetical protein CFBP3840_P100024 (plasmid) [Pseudomonas syringae]|uniref:Uncharacterized protein n=1 Tax=Pseudomonas syringae TaxID=317 RepID=A0A2K4X343_PSESX|nr:hypothetical protein CFBP3840_P100024 [Pseudomonas syringae]
MRIRNRLRAPKSGSVDNQAGFYRRRKRMLSTISTTTRSAPRTANASCPRELQNSQAKNAMTTAVASRAIESFIRKPAYACHCIFQVLFHLATLYPYP